MHKFNEENLGEFQEKDYGKYFTYKNTSDEWALSQGFYHEVDVLDGVRYAKVLTTIAHIAIDEDAEGKTVVEIWKIKKHIRYNRS